MVKAEITTPTIAALTIALCGPPLLAIVGARVLRDSPGLAIEMLCELVMWAFLGFVLLIVVYAEKRPLTSIGLKRPRWSTIVSALLMWLALTYLLSPVTNWLVGLLGYVGVDAGVARLRVLPVWFRVFLALTGGIVEETLYRGYAVERLASLTGRDWIGGLIAALIFGVAHIPAWGIGFALIVDLPFGLVMTAFYLWRRDLLANIIVHTAALTVSLIWLPPAHSN